MAVKPAPRKSAMGGRGKAAAAVPGRRNAILSKGAKPGRKTLPNAVAGRTGTPVSPRQPRNAAPKKNAMEPRRSQRVRAATGGAGGPELGTGYSTRRRRMSDTARAIADVGAGAARVAKSIPVKSTRGGVGSMNSNVGKAAAKRPAKPKANVGMTPRESASRKLASERLAQRQSMDTPGMWSNDKPRKQSVPKKPKYKDPTKIKGFSYGRMTE